MDRSGEIKAEGVLKKYLEDSDLIDYENGNPVSTFEHVDPEKRDPNGFFDYVLQTFADFASEDMGGEDVLVFRTEREAFSRYAKINRLRASLIKDVMDIYGFDLEDQYYSEGMNSGSSQFGQSLSQLTEVIPYDGKTRTHNGLEYEKGLTEEEINTAIETVFREN